MITRNIDIFKGHNVIGNIIPVHSNVVSGVHEHFDDGDKFITVSEDGSLAVTNSETLEIIKFDNLSKAPILSSEMVFWNEEKTLLLGNQKGNILKVDQKYSSQIILKNKRMEISSICDLGDGTILLAHGDDIHGSTIQYCSLYEDKIINEIKLRPGRKIKQMHKIQGVKDKCVVSCSACNIYWFKVIDGELKLIIDQPSPDDYYYDEVWSDGKTIIKAGESCYRREGAPIFIKNMLSGERQETRGKANSMFVGDEIVIRAHKGEFRIMNRDGMSINKIHLPNERFPMHIKMQPFGRILMGFHTGEVGRFEFRNQSLRLIMS